MSQNRVGQCLEIRGSKCPKSKCTITLQSSDLQSSDALIIRCLVFFQSSDLSRNHEVCTKTISAFFRNEEELNELLARLVTPLEPLPVVQAEPMPVVQAEPLPVVQPEPLPQVQEAQLFGDMPAMISLRYVYNGVLIL